MPERLNLAIKRLTSSTFWNKGFVGEATEIVMNKEKSLGNKIWNLTWRGGAVLTLAACNVLNRPTEPQAAPGPLPTNAPEISLAPTAEILPLVQPLTIEEVDTFWSRCVNCEDLGVRKDSINGGDFGGDDLLHANDDKDADYFWLIKENGEAEQLDGTNAQTGVILHSMPKEGQTAEDLDVYFAWDIKVVDSQDRVVVTYQPDGTPKSAEYYAIPPENSIYAEVSYKPSGQTLSVEPTIAVKTPEPTSTPIPADTPTPTETALPEKDYVCPTNPDNPAMTRLSLKDDIQSGKLANWARSQPGFNTQISTDPSKLDYHISKYDSDGSNNLSAHSIDKPGWAELHSKVLGICKINPSEFGLSGKNDAFIIISVVQDKNNKRMVQFTLTGREGINSLYYGGSLLDPKNGINAMNKLNSTSNVVLILKGATPGKEDDLRPLGVSADFYEAQKTTFNGVGGLKAVNAAFNEVEATDTFSDEVVKLFESTIFYTAQYRDSD